MCEEFVSEGHFTLTSSESIGESAVWRHVKLQEISLLMRSGL